MAWMKVVTDGFVGHIKDYMFTRHTKLELQSLVDFTYKVLA